MDIQKLKTERQKLNEEIYKVVTRFEELFGGEVQSINIQRIDLSTYSQSKTAVEGIKASVVWRDGQDEITIG